MGAFDSSPLTLFIHTHTVYTARLCLTFGIDLDRSFDLYFVALVLQRCTTYVSAILVVAALLREVKLIFVVNFLFSTDSFVEFVDNLGWEHVLCATTTRCFRDNDKLLRTIQSRRRC